MTCLDDHACLDYLACPERDLAENRKAIAPPPLPPVVESDESGLSDVARERQRRDRDIPGSIETDLQPAAEGSKAVSSPRQPDDLKNREPDSLSSGNETSVTGRGNQGGKETQHSVLTQQPTRPAVEQTPGQPAAASGPTSSAGKEVISSLFNEPPDALEPAQQTSPDPLDALFEPAEEGQPEATPTAAPPPIDHLNVRRWRDRTGQFACRAQLLKVTASAIQLLKTTGHITTVPWARLSDQDLRFVSNHLHAQRVLSGRAQSVHPDRDAPLAVQAERAHVGH